VVTDPPTQKTPRQGRLQYTAPQLASAQYSQRLAVVSGHLKSLGANTLPKISHFIDPCFKIVPTSVFGFNDRLQRPFDNDISDYRGTVIPRCFRESHETAHFFIATALVRRPLTFKSAAGSKTTKYEVRTDEA